MENLTTISQRLSYLIKEKGITQYQLSSAIGITEGTLSKILSGKTKKLRENTLKLLANYFNVSEDWLRMGNSQERKITVVQKSQESGNSALERLIAANESLATSNRILAENNAKLIMYLDEYQKEKNCK